MSAPPGRGGGREVGPEPARAPWRARLALAAVVALGLALHLPMAGLGFYADDFVHRLALEHPELDVPMEPWSLYDFGGAADWRALAERGGTFPWWTDERWAVRFFRPLASLSLWLDHALFGRSAAAAHATSLALWAALLLAAHALYRALGLGRGAALLGTAVLACSDAAALPVGWIANRNSVLAALFTVLAALVLERGARGAGAAAGSRPAEATRLTGRRIAAALGLAVLACLSKESGVAALALVALRLAMLARASAEPAARARALRGAVGALALAAVLVAGLVAAGFGTRSLFYATPWRDPLAYLRRVGILASAGTLSLLGPVPLDLAAWVPRVVAPLVGGSLALLAAIGAWAARARRGLPGAAGRAEGAEEDACARRIGAAGGGEALFLAAWIGLAVLPEGGAPPSVRLLLPAAVGGAGLLALLVSAERARARRAWGMRALTALLVVSATAGSGLFLLASGFTMRALSAQMRAIVRETDLGVPADGPRDALVLQADSGFTAFSLAATRAGLTGDDGLAVHPLQLGRRGLRWTRTDARTFELESLAEPFLQGPFERLYRVSESVPPVGTVWRTPAFTVEALERDASGLRRLRVRLAERDLDDPRVVFLVAGGPGVVPIEPPAAGETLVVPTFVSPRPYLP